MFRTIEFIRLDITRLFFQLKHRYLSFIRRTDTTIVIRNLKQYY